MESTCDQEVTLVSVSGEKLKVSQNVLEESSMYMNQVLSNSKSKVLLFPDVHFEDLKDLIDQVQLGTELKEDLHTMALKYGFKSENDSTIETNLPIKKRPLELTPPSSPDNNNLVIDEELSPVKTPSPCKSPTPSTNDSSIAPFLPWPLLLQHVAMQKQADLSHNELNVPIVSNLTSSAPSAIFSGYSSRVEQSESSQAMDGKDMIDCEDCGKSFKASTIHIHKRRVHRPLKEPAKCCGQEFPTRWHLTQHRKSGDHLPTLWRSGDRNEEKIPIAIE